MGETPVFWYFRSDGVNISTIKTTLGDELGSEEKSQLRRDLAIFIEALFHTNNGGQTLLHIVAKRLCGNPAPKYGSINKMKKEKELCERKAKDIVYLFQGLLEKGLDPIIEDDGHRTALDVTAACGNDGILELFR